MDKKTKYRFFLNSRYAFAGLKDMIQTETSFRLELCVMALLWGLLPLAPVPLNGKLIMGLSLFLPLIAEAVNSAIERTVDLVTLEQNLQAKRAKDVGSAIVFLTIVLTVLIWTSIWWHYYLL